jgi:acetylornithine deacetylase
VETLLRILIELARYHEEKRPELIYNIRNLFSSPEGFVVPDRCEAWIDSHLPPDAPIGDITLELEEIIERYREKHPHPDLSLRFTTLYSGFSLPEKGPVVDSLRQAFVDRSLPWRPEVFRSHSDANILWEAGMKPIILGPGQLEKAHAPEESISFVQTCLAAELFHDMMVAMASQ